MTILYENSSYARARCITIYIKGLLNVTLSQYGRGGEKILQGEKSLFTFFTSFELGVLLQEFSHWLGNLG
jgi:hypothetical protein